MELLINLLTGVLVIWIVQTLLAVFTVREPFNKIVNAVVVVMAVLYMVSGQVGLFR